ncbi:hypothetical protein NLJ89_g5900 [Agrocybe chaxingu]|uniref:Uncharacterized protein n=1 Tax=Agrocybe chaxingu TaxID=84603 RepID=A0A9W8MUL0_9AGAR|nr:hypothetical protein NLJ89_g5900 [Agrocybe chaxingu]
MLFSFPVPPSQIGTALDEDYPCNTRISTVDAGAFTGRIESERELEVRTPFASRSVHPSHAAHTLLAVSPSSTDASPS